MGIFSRIGDIMKANVNDLIDKAEDPEKMVKQIIRDLQQEVAKSTQALGKAMASQRIAERQYKTALQSSADWESKAKAALAAGNTEMAKKALSYKVKADNDVASYQQMYETITTQTDAIRNQVETLKAKLEEAIKACDILVNATIMGMKPHEDVTLVDKSLFRKDLVVADTVYNPEKTKMILEAEEAGCKAIGGAGMLLQQGAVNYELFVGKEMPLAEYQEFQKAQAK